MLKWRRPPTAPGWVAVAPCDGRVYAVHVQHAPESRPLLSWADSASWAEPSSALRELRRRGRLNGYRRLALLERAQYHLIPMAAPNTPPEEWRDAARWSLKDSVEFPVENAGVALLQVPTDPGRHRPPSLLAVVCAHTHLAALATASSDAYTPWEVIDIPEIGLRNIAALAEVAPGAQALLHVNAVHSTLVIVHQGELLLARQIDVGLTQLMATDANERQTAHERASLRLQRTLDSFEREFSYLSLTSLLVCPGATLTSFIAYARELVYVPMLALELSDYVDLSATPELTAADQQGIYLPAIGAALRGH